MTVPNDKPSIVHAIVVAAGSGTRSKMNIPKQFVNIAGQSMVRHSVESFLSHPKFSRVWVVVGSGQKELLTRALMGLSDFDTVTGGETRQQSVLNGLHAIQSNGGCDTVLVHDAARPGVDHEIIDKLLLALDDHPGAMPVLAMVDTVVRREDDKLGDTLDREQLGRVQTPQAFDFELLLNAHHKAKDQADATDDAQLFKRSGHCMKLIEGDERLRKYTTESDFKSAHHVLEHRTGMGFDVHRLEAGEELWLGGIKLDHEKGLSGHSDADVLLHALTDALLGAIGAGDIGDHFPPSDTKWQGASSSQFIKHAASLIRGQSGKIVNVDMTIICEVPKIKPHREEIRQNIAKLLHVPVSRVSIKATTTEALGFTGRGEGIAAQAIATIALETL